MNVHEKRNAILGVEFDCYVRDHPSLGARIPRRAQIVLLDPFKDELDRVLHGRPGEDAW